MNFKVIISFILTAILVAFFVSCGEQPKAEENENTGTAKGVPVETIIIAKKSVEQNISLTGVFEPASSVDIISEVSGKIEVVKKELGAFITVKDTLAVIDDKIPLANFEQARAQVLSAENNLHIAKLNLESDKELLESGDISKLAYENSVFNYKSADANLLAAKANMSVQKKSYSDTRITSPINGFISRKNVELGTMVNIGQMLYRVVDITTLKISVGIPQSVISAVKPGSRAEISVSGSGNDSYPGVIKYISPQADENTGSFQVEIYVKNTPDRKIKAGMTAKINLIAQEEEERLVIPDYAIVTKNNSNYVYKIVDGQAKLTEITTGGSFGSQIEVSAGLEIGDQIVVVGMKNLGVDTKVLVERPN